MSARSEKSFEWVNDLLAIERSGLLRSMPVIDGMPGRMIRVNGMDAINFSGNNYLDMAGNNSVMEAMSEAARIYGNGATASRLIAGNTKAHRELEEYIAVWKGTEKAVVFGSGYQANIGILTALPNDEDLILSDELNHASIIDGCRLSRAQTRIYQHLDVDSARKILEKGKYRRRFVVTESVFSMDGDFAPLVELNKLCEEFGAFLMVDEAHGAGVKGPKGQGLAAELNVCPEIQMGTLGKALGVAGAYVAGSEPLVRLIINKARSFIYTTAQPPLILSAALEAIRIVASDEGCKLRKRLNDNALLLNELIRPLIGTLTAPSHIVPIHIGDSMDTMRISQSCLKKGIFVQGIRYPSVPEGSARLRLTLMSSHTSDDIRKAANVLLEEAG